MTRNPKISLKTPQSTAARFLILSVCFAAAAAGSYFLFQNFIFAQLPNEIVGAWGVEGGDQDGATLEFHRNGSFVARVNLQGREGIVHARVAVQDKKLQFTSMNPHTGKEETKTQIIKHLTEKEMILEEPNGRTSKLVRLE